MLGSFPQRPGDVGSTLYVYTHTRIITTSHMCVLQLLARTCVVGCVRKEGLFHGFKGSQSGVLSQRKKGRKTPFDNKQREQCDSKQREHREPACTSVPGHRDARGSMHTNASR